MTTKGYLLSLPERLLRSVLGLGAGVAREFGEVALPDAIRQTTSLHGGLPATQSSCSVSSRFARRPCGSSQRSPTSAAWGGV
jgi:hypothetical protein